jgi:hypothetical protein
MKRVRVKYPFTASVGVASLVVGPIVDPRKPVLQPDQIHCFGGYLAEQIFEHGSHCLVFGCDLTPLLCRNRQIFGALRCVSGANSLIKSI